MLVGKNRRRNIFQKFYKLLAMTSQVSVTFRSSNYDYSNFYFIQCYFQLSISDKFLLFYVRFMLLSTYMVSVKFSSFCYMHAHVVIVKIFQVVGWLQYEKIQPSPLQVLLTGIGDQGDYKRKADWRLLTHLLESKKRSGNAGWSRVDEVRGTFYFLSMPIIIC